MQKVMPVVGGYQEKKMPGIGGQLEAKYVQCW